MMIVNILRRTWIAALAFSIAPIVSFCTVPLTWDVETSEPTVENFAQFRGTEIDFTANLKSNGRPLPVRGESRLWWQTNGMDNLWWSVPAKVSGSRMSATFYPSNDFGASEYTCFIGIPKSIYSAAFKLKFLGSPGAEPNSVPLPTRFIDFGSVEVRNAPWGNAFSMSSNAVESAGRAMDRADAAAELAEIAGKAAELAISKAEESYSFSTNHTADRISSITNRVRAVEDAVNSMPSFDDISGFETKARAEASYYPKAEGELWAAWWSGDGFRVTVTNYNVAPAADVPWARLPSARFEYRPDGTNALRVVWDEETKWARWREAFAAYTNAAAALLDLKAGLDWGRTTPTGFDAPEGFTWLDTPATAIAGGLAWQKTLTSEGAVWVLSSNGTVAQLGADGAATNGYFRISDERGEPVFEVRAGDRVTVGAQAESVFPWTAADGRVRLRVVYAVQSAEPPTLHAASRLVPGGRTQWTALGAEGCPALAQGWTGASGAWTNAVWLAEAPAEGGRDQLFVYATYERGGDAVVKNHAAVAMEKIVLGGKTWTLGTASISGKTVLTLEEAAQ